MKLCVLGSGSKGNCTFIEYKNTKIMIDAGISGLQVHRRAEKEGIEIDGLDAVFFTHEHVDHVNGIGVLTNKYNPDIFMTPGTLDNLHYKNYDKIIGSNIYKAHPYKKIEYKDIIITPLATSHDASEPVGYAIELGSINMCYITDTGFISENTLDIIDDFDIYIIESNHDPELLNESNRPYYLKQRILNDKGHLSNLDCSYALSQVVGDNTKLVILAHVSAECNTYELPIEVLKEVFEKTGKEITFEVVVAKQNESMLYEFEEAEVKVI